MFAIVHGAWPRVTPDGVELATIEADVEAGRAEARALDDAIGRVVSSILEAQAEAGMELVTDGQVRWRDLGEAALAGIAAGARPLLDAWQATAALTDRAVAQPVPGPYTLGRRTGGRATADARRDRTMELADALAAEVRDLAGAGCPVILVEEPGAVELGDDPSERRLFVEAQGRLLALAPEIHATLVVSGGAVPAPAREAVAATPYRSFLLDLIAGPDNWYQVRATPGDRGIVCGALRVEDPVAREDQAPLLVWAARYAASMDGRGPARVGLANAGPLSGVALPTALTLVRQLGRAARLTAMTPAEAVAAGLDPLTFGRPRPRQARGAG